MSAENWIVSPCGDVRTLAPEDKFVATVYGSGAQKKQRARLIAAAPNMLRFLMALHHANPKFPGIEDLIAFATLPPPVASQEEPKTQPVPGDAGKETP